MPTPLYTKCRMIKTLCSAIYYISPPRKECLTFIDRDA
jgi:hypothetical protein